MTQDYVEWTEPMKARFLALLEANHSYGDIAKILSGEFHVRLTKNSCVGKGRRMHVPLRMPARKSLCLKRSVPRKPKLSPLQRSEQRKLRQRKRKLRAHPLRKRHREPPPRLRDLTLLQLLPTSCRWPSGNNPPFTFCGDRKVDGSAYCLKHARIASPAFGRAR
jgi:GcrA cell cycle regulator